MTPSQVLDRDVRALTVLALMYASITEMRKRTLRPTFTYVMRFSLTRRLMKRSSTPSSRAAASLSTSGRLEELLLVGVSHGCSWYVAVADGWAAKQGP